MGYYSDCRRLNESGYVCSCFQFAPCSFCTSMTADEQEQYAEGGLDTLARYWRHMDERIEATAGDECPCALAFKIQGGLLYCDRSSGHGRPHRAGVPGTDTIVAWVEEA